jgi:transposase-like protein
MIEWAAKFPDRLPEHYVFPAEQYSFNAKEKVVKIRNHNPNRPIGTWRTAWTAVRRRAGVNLRFHDLRHTTVTRLLENQQIEQIAPIMGWSASTMLEMMIRYQHRNLEKKRETMAALLPTKDQAAKLRSSAVGQSGVTSSLSQPEFISVTPNSRYDREELYEKVWKLPLRVLAREYGVSDVALAKACRRLHVPLPGRGYWAKKAANKLVEARPPLPPVSGTL